jgi:HEAT repeat protein
VPTLPIPTTLRAAIAAYLGDDDSFDRAVAAFALAYARQTREDHAAFTRALADGRLPSAPPA